MSCVWAGVRRSAVLVSVCLGLWGSPLVAQPARSGPPSDASLPAALKPDTYRLWAGRAPGASSDAPGETPLLTVYRPQADRANGSAVVIAPGGGYIGLASQLEGVEPAAWFTARGVTAFVLTYRIGATARLPIPLYDGARAVRFVRAHAAEFGIHPDRIGMMGFSAGGHLAATTAVEARDGQPSASDVIERVSSRPDFLILAYPWLEGTQLGPDGRSQYCTFAAVAKGPSCDPTRYVEFAPLRSVTSRVAPTFIYHTTDDELVPVAGSIRFYQALVEHGVPAEFHAFKSGRHGSGMGGSSPALSRWPELLDGWLRGLGVVAANSK
jgi:acetyl esterase/lipase